MVQLSSLSSFYRISPDFTGLTSSPDEMKKDKKAKSDTILQQVTLIASLSIALFGIALAIAGKPLIGLSVSVLAIGIGFYIFTCTVFNPGPLPDPVQIHAR